MPLADFGNRIPQLCFEVFRPVPGIEDFVRAVCVIPGSTEFGYDTEPVTRNVGEGAYEAENAHVLRDVSDWTASIDELQALCPNLEWVTLVVAWFGDDLRAGSCTIRPKVDEADKSTLGGDLAGERPDAGRGGIGEPDRRPRRLWRVAERPFGRARDRGSESSAA